MPRPDGLVHRVLHTRVIPHAALGVGGVTFSSSNTLRTPNISLPAKHDFEDLGFCSRNTPAANTSIYMLRQSSTDFFAMLRFLPVPLMMDVIPSMSPMPSLASS